MRLTHEYRIALQMALSAFFTLAGYEFLRSSSTVLFKTAYGADNLPLVMAAMPFVIFAGVWVYGRILSALGPRRTLLVTTLGSAGLILLCYLAVAAGSRPATAVLYLVKEFYIVLLIEQYWSYINSSLTPATARRVNGPITGVAGLGGALGGTLVGLSAEVLGTQAMIVIAAVALVPAAIISDFAYRRHGEPLSQAEQPAKGHMGLGLFRESSALRYLLAIVLATQVVAAVLDLKFQSLLSLEFVGQQDRETAFQGSFFGVLNWTVLILQFLIVPILLNVVSVRVVHILMPAIHLVAIGIAIAHPTVWTVGAAFFLFKAFDYSLFRAAKEILYIPLSFDTRYRAKEVIDVFGYRTGKGLSSVVIVAFQRTGAAVSDYYAGAAFIAASLWLALVFPLTREVRADAVVRPSETSLT